MPDIPALTVVGSKLKTGKPLLYLSKCIIHSQFAISHVMRAVESARSTFQTIFQEESDVTSIISTRM
jgi:hypothetical protein